VVCPDPKEQNNWHKYQYGYACQDRQPRAPEREHGDARHLQTDDQRHEQRVVCGVVGDAIVEEGPQMTVWKSRGPHPLRQILGDPLEMSAEIIGEKESSC